MRLRRSRLAGNEYATHNPLRTKIGKYRGPSLLFNSKKELIDALGRGGTVLQTIILFYLDQ